MELIHYVDFVPDQIFFDVVRDRYELGGENVSGLTFPATVHHTERSGTDFLQDIVVIVYGLRFDVHRLRHVFRVNVEN